jgi:tetratricopeptide (TPR) repeat protein
MKLYLTCVLWALTVASSPLDKPPSTLQQLRSAYELDLIPAATALARTTLADPQAAPELRAAAALVLAQSGALDTARRGCAGDTLVERLARARIALEQEDDPQTALRLLGAATAPREPSVRDADSAEAWLLCGRALGRAGSLQAAEPFLTRGLELDRHHLDAPKAHALLLSAALERGDTRTAPLRAETARQVAQWHALWKARRLQALRRPAEPLPRIGLAELWLAVNEPQRALEPLEDWLAGVDQPRSDVRVLALSGECLRRLGQRAAARERLEVARALEPKRSETRYFQALLALDANDLSLAKSELEAVCSDPAAVDGRLLRAHLDLARLLWDTGAHEDARTRHTRYRELGGSEPLTPARR